MKKTTLLFAFLLCALPIPTQAKALFVQAPVQQIRDTNKIVNVVYPPLTEREGKGMNVPKPPDEHPRLFFRAKDIPALKKKVGHPLMKACWDKIAKMAALPTDGRLEQTDAKENLNDTIRESIEAKALMYAFFRDRKVGRTAVDALLNYYATMKINLDKDPYYASIDIGRTILAASMVYDWCYDLLTPNEKAHLIGRMETMATKLEIQWPQLIEGSINGHGTEAQFSRDVLAFGIATYDEKPAIYNLVAGRIIAEFVPVRKFFYSASYHHQGTSYGPSRFYWEMWSTLLFNGMGYPNIYGTDQGKVPYRWIYMRRPDGQLFREGDGYKEKVAFGTYWTNPDDALTGHYFNDPILIGEAIKQGQTGKTPYYLFDYLFFNTSVEPQMNKSNLPLTRYFPEPLGAMVARTGWDEGFSSTAVVADMKIGVYHFSNHQHLDAGSFQLYYKGPLAIESGIYEGRNGGYGSEHFKHYYQRTIAHNSMLVYDPDEEFMWMDNVLSNDGGQQYPEKKANAENLEEFLKKDYKTGEILAHDFGPDSIRPDYTYLKGELAEAYSDKVKSFQRSFVFLNLNDTKIPAALIVFDRVSSSNDDFQKYWLLHSIEEPLVSGTTTVISRTERDYNGKMVNTTLLPAFENLIIHKIGGSGNEFNVFGTNYPQAPRRPGSTEAGSWRIEVSPKEPAVVDHFLNVMQVMDHEGGPAPLQAEKVEAGEFVGARISDRIVLFRKDGTLNDEKVRVNITGRGNYKVLLTDMKEGQWRVECVADRSISIASVTSNGKVVYFEGRSGEYVISR